MKNKSANYFMGLLSLMLSSCFSTTPKYLFAPNSTNLIDIKNKGDLKAALNYSSTRHPSNDGNSGRQNSNGIDVQSAFAFSNKFAVKLDGFSKWETNRSVNTSNNPYQYLLKYKRIGEEFSVGYYTLKGEKKQLALNIFAGVGAGKTSFNGTYRLNSANTYFYNAQHTKFFLVPSIRLNLSDNYSIGVAYKLTSVDFHNINTNDVELTKGLYKSFADKNSVYSDFVIENQFCFEQIKKLKFHLQFGVSKLFTSFNYINEMGSAIINEQYQYNNRFASIGLVADIKTLIKKK